MKKIFNYLLLVIFLCPSITLAANKYITTGNNFEMKDNFDNSHFAFGSDVSVVNKVDGIYAVFGESVDYNADNEYVALFGNKVNVSGTIKDGAIFGNSVKLNGAYITRDIVIFANRVELSGTFSGNVKIYANTVDIDSSHFMKNLSVETNDLTITGSSSINGTLEYFEGTNLTLDDNNYNVNILEKLQEESKKDLVVDKICAVIRLLVIFLAMYLIIPKFFDKISNNVSKNLGFGLISFLILPIILLILLFTNLATSVSLIGIMLYVILIMISKVLVGYVIGKYLSTKLFKLEEKKYLSGLMGIILLEVFTFIPYIGGLITFITLIYSFGIITNMYLDSRKKS